MTASDADLTNAVLAALRAIAPEIDPARLDPDRPLREQAELDSMDWLHLLTDLHARTGADIGEADAGPRLSLRGLCALLAARGAVQPAGSRSG
ncbi:MAG: acyl carrier protein [Betaproteobacteria bacterium]|nr:acyl carrier protein [Betaproteobacteria bacterium]